MKSDWVDIRKGVRQGCVLSPDLFSLYGQKCLERLEDLEGVRIGGRNVTNIRYADDTVLVADSEEKLQRLVDEVKEASEVRGLKINTKKTEVLGITKRRQRLRVRIYIGGRQIKQVQEFKYLGSIVSEEADCEKEIKKRIVLAKTAFINIRNLITNLSMRMDLKVRLLKCYVWSVLLYGCETWTIKKKMEKKLEATEMWFLRRIQRIPWTARVTNEEVLRRAGLERGLMKSIKRRQLQFLGHILRARGMERDCLLGRIDGRRARGRQRKKYMETLLESIDRGWNTVDLIRMAEERKEWRSMIADVT